MQTILKAHKRSCDLKNRQQHNIKIKKKKYEKKIAIFYFNKQSTIQF